MSGPIKRLGSKTNIRKYKTRKRAIIAVCGKTWQVTRRRASVIAGRSKRDKRNESRKGVVTIEEVEVGESDNIDKRASGCRSRRASCSGDKIEESKAVVG